MLKRPNSDNPRSMQYRFRKKRFAVIEEIIKKIIDKNGHASVLDIGGRGNYWAMMDPSLYDKVSITLLNTESELDTYKIQNNDIHFLYKTGDGCNLSDFDDKSFDLSHSNSVIEHVGSLENMIKFANETRRVGNAYYVQTPFLWFPIDPHYGVPFFHWLPGPTRAYLMSKYKIGYSDKSETYEIALWDVDHTQMVDRYLMKKLFPDAEVIKEKFMLMTKSIICKRNPDMSLY